MPEKILGTVKWFSNRKGYGFITPKSDNSPTKEDIFVHQSSIHCDGYRTLMEGWEVEFEASPDDSGKLKAQNVTAPGGGPCVGPRPMRPRRPPREGGQKTDDEEEDVAPAAEGGTRSNGDNGKGVPPRRTPRPNGSRISNDVNRGPPMNRPKKPQWHDVLTESVKQELLAKSIRTNSGTVDVALGDTRVKLGTGGYASLAHATGLLAEGSFTCDEHGLVNLEWQRALQAGADGSWGPTPVEQSLALIKTFNLTSVEVTAVGNDETPEKLWGSDKHDPRESLESNGFQMRRVVLTRISTGGGPRNRYRGRPIPGRGGGGGIRRRYPPRQDQQSSQPEPTSEES